MSLPSARRPGRRGFVTTRWSQVLAAGRGTTPQERRALAELCQLYWAPVHVFFCRLGRPADEARDLTQGFFARLLEKEDLAAADPQVGRFRDWLLASARNYLANVGKHERALKRGGDQIRIDFDEAERVSGQTLALGLSPEQAYERSCAVSLVAKALGTLREEYQRGNKVRDFEKLKGTLTGEPVDAYARIAEELKKTPGAVKAEAFRLKRRWKALILAEVARTVEVPEDADTVHEEVRALISAYEVRP